MTILGEKPPIEDVMEHYGVLGMKWGKTRARATGGEVRSARARLDSERMRYNAQRMAVAGARTKGEKDAAKKELGKIGVSYLKNPDRVTAARLTRGEKVAAILLLGPIGVAGIAGQSAVSRRIEYKQDKKAYDK